MGVKDGQRTSLKGVLSGVCIHATVRQAGVVRDSGDRYTFTTLLSLLLIFVPD